FDLAQGRRPPTTASCHRVISSSCQAVLRLRFLGAAATPELTATDQLEGRVNFLLGDDPAHWHTDLPTYGSLVYRALYPGIDLYYSGAEGTLKSTYTLAPHADPSRIHWRYTGATDVRLDGAGNLAIALAGGPKKTDALTQTLLEHAPIAW